MLEVDKISFCYKNAKEKVLDQISFSLEKNQIMAILGNNGVGKSTLIKCLNRINKISSGKILVENKNIFEMTRKELAQNIAYVPQYTEKINMNVFDTILLGRKPYIKWDVSNKDREIVFNIIKKMGLESFTLRNMSELSGGEVQKVLIARALAQEPKVLLLDEPTSNLDPYNKHEVMDLIKSISEKEDICTIIVLHDLNLSLRYCNQFIFLKATKIFDKGGKNIFTEKLIKDVYNMDVEIFTQEGNKFIIPKFKSKEKIHG